MAPYCDSIRNFGTRPWLDYSSSLYHGCNLEVCFRLYETSLKSSHRPPSPVHFSSLMFPNLFLAIKHIENNRACIQKNLGFLMAWLIKSATSDPCDLQLPSPPWKSGVKTENSTLYSELVPLAINFNLRCFPKVTLLTQTQLWLNWAC